MELENVEIYLEQNGCEEFKLLSINYKFNERNGRIELMGILEFDKSKSNKYRIYSKINVKCALMNKDNQIVHVLENDSPMNFETFFKLPFNFVNYLDDNLEFNEIKIFLTND